MRTPARRTTARRVAAGRVTAALIGGVVLLGVVACSRTVQGAAETAAGARVPTAESTSAPDPTIGRTPTSAPDPTTAPDTSVEPTDVIVDPTRDNPTTARPTAPPTVDLPTLGPDVSVTIEQDGAIVLAKGKPKVVIDEFQDPICPPCGRFWSQFGPELGAAVADGKIALRLHSVNFLDRQSASGDYSTRADASLLAVADLAGPNEVLKWESILYSTSFQPRENDPEDISSSLLATFAESAGFDPEVADAIDADDYRPDAEDAADAAITALGKAGRDSVPSTLVAGKPIDTSQPTWLKTLIG